ncbi:hypothetical protein FA15DRAFT_84770 [Coprinopsis marcescibilis]|uniref:Uncharacterized protein n=1 Tax=Coprinopsis marcescibilis TaxID=230819 RepID=A0A5C3KM48_COPMA|nr:hypothetical protein FA15DRAFT_84770 [Coprinopsis marcescibilis]
MRCCSVHLDWHNYPSKNPSKQSIYLTMTQPNEVDQSLVPFTRDRLHCPPAWMITTYQHAGSGRSPTRFFRDQRSQKRPSLKGSDSGLTSLIPTISCLLLSQRFQIV